MLAGGLFAVGGFVGGLRLSLAALTLISSLCQGALFLFSGIALVFDGGTRILIGLLFLASAGVLATVVPGEILFSRLRGRPIAHRPITWIYRTITLLGVAVTVGYVLPLGLLGVNDRIVVITLLLVMRFTLLFVLPPALMTLALWRGAKKAWAPTSSSPPS